MSRIEKILQAMIDETSYDKAPQSRIEAILLAIKNNTQYSHLPHGRIEEILLAIKNNTSYDKESMSRIEEILLAKLNSVEYTKLPQSRIEELLIEWIKQEIEFEGVPPLTYEAIEGTLKNYRIYGNTVNGENVGDLITEGEHAEEYKVPVTVEGKNLLQNTATSRTINGVTFTVNEDGSVTCNGTASNAAWFPVNRSFDLYAPEGRIVSIGNNGSMSTFYINISYVGNVTTSLNYSRTTHQNAYVQLIIAAGYTCDNLTLYPMIRLATIDDDTYEPYYAPVTTPIYLPKPLKMVGDEAEYIDYAEQKQHVATTYMVSITPKTDVSKIVFVTMSSVPVDCTILISGLIFTLDEADANTLNSTNYADGVRGKASTAHDYKYSWTKKYTEGETYYIRSYVKYQTADNEIKEAYGDVYKADINGFERVATSQTINTERDVTLPALPTLKGTNVLSVGTAVQPSKVYVKYKGG